MGHVEEQGHRPGRTRGRNVQIRGCAATTGKVPPPHERPHRALDRRTPATAYTATPKAAPVIAAQGEHWRIQTDRVDADGKVTLRHAGRLRHLGIGRAHKHKPIILLVRDADVTAVEHGTGEILAEFTIDPARGYQPKKQNTPGPK